MKRNLFYLFGILAVSVTFLTLVSCGGEETVELSYKYYSDAKVSLKIDTKQTSTPTFYVTISGENVEAERVRQICIKLRGTDYEETIWLPEKTLSASKTVDIGNIKSFHPVKAFDPEYILYFLNCTYGTALFSLDTLLIFIQNKLCIRCCKGYQA